MALFDRTIHIQAPRGIVWPRVRRLPSGWRVLLDQPDSLLVAADGGLGYVYLLERQADGSTRLRHLVEGESIIGEALETGQDLLAALVGPAEDPVDTDLALDVAAVEERLAHIKRESEAGAQRLRWQPQAAGGEPSLAAVVMPAAKTISPDYVSRAALPGGVPMSWFQVWKRALTRPTVATFEELIGAPDAQTGRAYQWVLVSSVIGALLTMVLLSVVINKFLTGPGYEPPGLAAMVGESLCALACAGPIGGVLAIVLFAIGVGVVQLIARVLGGAGEYADLTYAFAVFQAPLTLVSGVFVTALLGVMLLIPSIGPSLGYFSYVPLLAYVWFAIVAIKAVNRFAWPKAALAMLVPCAGLLALLSVLEIKNPYTDFGYEYLAIKHYNRAIDCMEEFDFAQAVEEYSRAIDLMPDFAYAYGQRGIAYAMRGDFERALADCDEAIALDPESGGAYLARGLVYWLAYVFRGEVNRYGEREKAIADLNMALRFHLEPVDQSMARQLLRELEP